MKELESIRKINLFNFKIVFGKASFDGMLHVLYGLANGIDIVVINILWIMMLEEKSVTAFHKHKIYITFMIELENMVQISLRLFKKIHGLTT